MHVRCGSRKLDCYILSDRAMQRSRIVIIVVSIVCRLPETEMYCEDKAEARIMRFTVK